MTERRIVCSLVLGILSLFAFFDLLISQETAVKEVILTNSDLDTAYEIIKIVSAISPSGEENNKQLIDSVRYLQGDAAIFCEQWPMGEDFSLMVPDSTGNVVPRQALCTDAIVVKFLDARAIKNRQKNAQKPPEPGKKSTQSGPDSIPVQIGDAIYPYQVLGVLNLKDKMFAQPGSIKDARTFLSTAAQQKGANAVIFVEYIGQDPYLNGARGIMIKNLEKWPKSGK